MLAVLVTVAAWASAFLAIRGVRNTFAPGALALGRLAVGSVVLSLALSIAQLSRHAWVRPSAREWTLIAICGLAWFAIYNVAMNAA